MVFNSLGSNYNFKFAMKALFGFGNASDGPGLKALLENQFQGQATLLYKGREAIALALRLLNLPKASAVAINGYTCYAVYQPIVEAGLTVEYLDVENGALNFSAQTLLESVQKNPQIKVVIIQNTLGYPCDVKAIAQVCKEKNLILIEDLAHSVGAKYSSGQPAGSVGDFVVLSFGQDKIIDAVSGGALIVKNKKYQSLALPTLTSVTSKKKLADRFYPNFTWKIRTNYSMGVGRIDHLILKKLGWLSQPMGADEKIILHSLPNWYAKMAKYCFENLLANISHRKTISQIYANGLNKKVLIPSVVSQINNSTNLRFPILVNNRELLISKLKTSGIHVSDIWYDAPIAPKKYLAKTNYNHECLNAEKISAGMLNLPTHINVTKAIAENIIRGINLWIQSQ
ncbi:MAG TPA: DegT/DnrJ/EryC1/StrS family aminotransferase [Candidatus Limnocylindria bacterium]|nr:DegT/DnrJ/EryC1/StrS family aminotransferase [Candidatus Limnocylindria bacterium]